MDFILKFKALVMKVNMDELYVIFLLKKNVLQLIPQGCIIKKDKG